MEGNILNIFVAILGIKKEKDDIKKPNIHENRRIVKIITSFVASIISGLLYIIKKELLK